MIRQVLRRASATFAYVLAVHRTPPEDREGLPRPRWWKAPICWVRGHRYGRRGSIEISSWRLEYCPCCEEEIAWRTSWAQIQSRPDDEDLPWDFWEDEEDGH